MVSLGAFQSFASRRCSTLNDQLVLLLVKSRCVLESRFEGFIAVTARDAGVKASVSTVKTQERVVLDNWRQSDDIARFFHSKSAEAPQLPNLTKSFAKGLGSLLSVPVAGVELYKNVEIRWERGHDPVLEVLVLGHKIRTTTKVLVWAKLFSNLLSGAHPSVPQDVTESTNLVTKDRGREREREREKERLRGLVRCAVPKEREQTDVFAEVCSTWGMKHLWF
eukprot:3130748-Amphidinium_carterae.1